MRHHDGRVQRGEVERGDGLVVVAALGLNDGGALEVVVARLALVRGDQHAAVNGLAQDLGDDLKKGERC